MVPDSCSLLTERELTTDAEERYSEHSGFGRRAELPERNSIKDSDGHKGCASELRSCVKVEVAVLGSRP